MVFLKNKFVIVYIKWVCHLYVGSATVLPDIIQDMLPMFSMEGRAKDGPGC